MFSTGQAMGVFKCIHTGEKYVLNADMSIECMTPEHNAWMVVGAMHVTAVPAASAGRAARTTGRYHI